MVFQYFQFRVTLLFVKRVCLTAFISDIFVWYFRGEVIIGGFVVKELSSDPPSCLVTYLTRVDLKGRLNLFLRVVFDRFTRQAITVDL